MDTQDHNEYSHEQYNPNCNCLECCYSNIYKFGQAFLNMNIPPACRGVAVTITKRPEPPRAPGIMQWKGLNYFISGKVRDSDTYAMSLILKSIYRSNEK